MSSPLSQEVIDLLQCPRSQQALHLASADELAQWASHAEGLDGLLINEDGTVAYPVEDGFPILLHDRALTKDDAEPNQS